MVPQTIITIDPYMEKDGVRTLSDSAVASLFSRLQREHLVRWSFFDGSIKDAKSFVWHMKNGNWLYLVKENTDVKALFWLNHLERRSCWLHFTGFKDSWGDWIRQAGRFVLRWLLSASSPADGHPIFDSILGVIPRTNKMACRFASDVGMQNVGVAPNLLYDDYTQTSVDACFFSAIREEE